MVCHTKKPPGQLVRLGSTPLGVSTCRLSTSSSPTGLPAGVTSGRTDLEEGFPLRCFQRLSFPYMATRPRPWRDDRLTSGPSTPVLSYWGQLLSVLLRPRQIGTELSHDVLNPARVPL